MAFLKNKKYKIRNKNPEKNFQKSVYETVKKIPRGRVMTYKRVAELSGRPGAWRAVGNVLNKSAGWRTKVPCHRVIRSDGKVGGYVYGTKKKEYLLEKEGVVIKNMRVSGKKN